MRGLDSNKIINFAIKTDKTMLTDIIKTSNSLSVIFLCAAIILIIVCILAFMKQAEERKKRRTLTIKNG